MNHEPRITGEEMGASALVVLKLPLRLGRCKRVEHLKELELDDRWWIEWPAVFPRVPAMRSAVSSLRGMGVVNTLSAQICLLQFV